MNRAIVGFVYFHPWSLKCSFRWNIISTPSRKTLHPHRAFGHSLVVSLLLLTLAGCNHKDTAHPRSSAEWQQMAVATESEQIAKSEQIGRLLEKPLPVDEPMWPVDTFLKGELYRLRDDPGDARKAYRALSEWGTKNSYNDGLGGGGLSAIALWRWVEIANSGSGVDKEEVSQILNCVRTLQLTRFARGMFSAPLLATLPQVEEQTVRGSARLAWLSGRKDEAERLFLEYLQLAHTKDLDDVEKQVWQNLLQTGQASEDRMTLFVATRLNVLGQSDDATIMFRKILKSDDPDVRAQAGYHLARLEQLRGTRPPVLIDMLTSALEDAAEPRLSQQILLRRAEIYDLPGKYQDTHAYESDLRSLVSNFPEGSLTYSALYQLARYYQESGNTEQALRYFEKLQNLQAGNPRFELSYYEAALALYTRSAPGDLAKATQVLQSLLKTRPNAALQMAALFWLGRFAEESGETEQAHRCFSEVVKKGPYDYYGIRARMHLNVGSNARLQPFPDLQTNAELNSAYRVRLNDPAFQIDSPYASRLQEELQSGLYLESLRASERLSHLYPSRRLEELAPQEIDSAHLFSRFALLLAFRQDALVATDLHPEIRLQVATRIGELSQDWPMAKPLCCEADNTGGRTLSSQHDPRFLTVAYPIAYAEAFRSAGTTYELQPELLYGIVREESFFYPNALSPDGALGLFQFIPSTFRILDQRWNLLKNSGFSSREEFLMNPDRSIDLGARWFHEYLLPANHGDIVAAVMEHNTNRKFVKSWSEKLRTTRRGSDAEYEIESISYLPTRLFVKGTLADMAIMKAAAALGPHSHQPSPSSASSR